MERPELITDPKYATPEARVLILTDVFGIIETWTQKYSKYEVLERCNALDIPCGPVLAMKELLEDKALRARGMIAAVEHPQRGTYYTVGCPLVLSDSEVDYRRAPLLGEHNEELLHELMGYDAAQVENLRAEGVI
jgi:formyl-CoA transferase